MNSSALVPQIPQTRQPQPKAGDPYLKFHLANHIAAAFSMRHVQEAIVLPSRRLTPMPNMPAAMLGLMNRRSRVNWVVDLAQLLGLQASSAQKMQYSLVMVQVGSVPLGLAVQQVEGLSWISPDAIQSPLGQVSLSLIPFLRGCVLQQQDQKQEIVLILDAEAIVQSPILLGVKSEV